jgi:hypothetical protein
MAVEDEWHSLRIRATACYVFNGFETWDAFCKEVRIP